GIVFPGEQLRGLGGLDRYVSPQPGRSHDVLCGRSAFLPARRGRRPAVHRGHVCHPSAAASPVTADRQRPRIRGLMPWNEDGGEGKRALFSSPLSSFFLI